MRVDVEKLKAALIAEQIRQEMADATAEGAEPDIAIYLIRKHAEQLANNFDVALMKAEEG